MHINNNQKIRKQRILDNFKRNLLITALIVFSCKITFASENISIETKSDNFFENLVSDSLLLLDPDLKKIIENDFSNVVTNSKFELPVNSWKPRPNPKIRLESIYNNVSNNNIENSFSSLIQPVVELACTPQQYDPINEIFAKCVKNMFKYSIIERIEIKYLYDSSKTSDKFISDLSRLNSSNRYQQIVKTTADIMNRSFERVRKKNVAKNVNIIKSPLPIIAASSPDSKPRTGQVKKSQIQKGMSKMEVQKILGKPDLIDVMPSGLGNKFEDWTYEQSGKEDLVIQFFTGGRSTEVYKITGQ